MICARALATHYTHTYAKWIAEDPESSRRSLQNLQSFADGLARTAHRSSNASDISFANPMSPAAASSFLGSGGAHEMSETRRVVISELSQEWVPYMPRESQSHPAVAAHREWELA